MLSILKDKKVQYAGLAIGVAALSYIYLRNRKNAQIKKQITTFKNSTITVGGSSVNVIEVARQLGNDLGISFSAFDPRSWAENDTAVRDIILNFPKSLMGMLSLEYFTLYKRNLQSDVQKLLPLSFYNQIKTKFY